MQSGTDSLNFWKRKKLSLLKPVNYYNFWGFVTVLVNPILFFRMYFQNKNKHLIKSVIPLLEIKSNRS
jgi:hypothetical protein